MLLLEQLLWYPFYHNLLNFYKHGNVNLFLLIIVNSVYHSLSQYNINKMQIILHYRYWHICYSAIYFHFPLHSIVNSVSINLQRFYTNEICSTSIVSSVKILFLHHNHISNILFIKTKLYHFSFYSTIYSIRTLVLSLKLVLLTLLKQSIYSYSQNF